MVRLALPSVLPVLALASLALAAHSAQGAPAGAIAPKGAWVTHGGSPARNRATRTPPLRSMPHRAWTFEAPGDIDGDPLVWGGRAFVAYRDGDGYGLHVLDLRDGSPIAELRSREPGEPPAPCVWSDTLLVRDGDLRAYRVGSRGLHELWSVAPQAAFGPPLLFEDEVYVVDGDALVRLDARTGAEVWRDAGGHHGRPSLRGDDVFVPGRGELAVIDVVARADGAPRARVATVSSPGGMPADDEPGGAFVAAMAGELVLYVDEPIPWTPTQSTSSVTAALDQRAPRDAMPLTWIFHHVQAAELDDGWIAATENEQLGGAHWFLNKGTRFVPLATLESQPELAARREAPCRAGWGAYLGGTAIELPSSLVLWRFDEEIGGPLIPARDALLAVRDARTLEAWRTRDPVGASELGYGAVRAEDEGVRLTDARAALVGGAIEEGDVMIEQRGDERTLVMLRSAGSAKDLIRQRTYPLAESAVVLSADDRLIFAAGPTAILRGVEALIDERLGEAYTELAIDALPSRDYTLVAAIVERARACGVDEKGLSRATKQLDRNGDKGAEERRDELAAPIEERLAALDRRRQERLCAMVAALPEEEHDLRYQLLRGALLVDPEYADALAVVPTLRSELRVALLQEVALAHPDAAGIAATTRALLPAALDPPEPFATLDWLAYLETASHVAIEILEPKPAAADLGPEERKLGSAALHWRKDVKGFKSDNLFVITPVSRPGAIARCLSTGELVCQALDEIFAGGESRRDQRYPLYIHLFENKAEYLKYGGESGHLDLGWTGGFYSEGDNYSRLYIPAGDDDFDAVQRVFVHELTHQWIRNRCPLFTNEEAVKRLHEPPTGGRWIVEGFASLIEEFTFDPAAWRWSFQGSSSRRRDLATSATDEQRLPWELALSVGAQGFAEIDTNPEHAIPLRTQLGMVTKASRMSLFYAQSQAISYYLFAADDGAHREKLLRYLAAYYRGDEAGLDVATAFGMSPDELGERATAFAHASLR